MKVSVQVESFPGQQEGPALSLPFQEQQAKERQGPETTFRKEFLKVSNLSHGIGLPHLLVSIPATFPTPSASRKKRRSCRLTGWAYCRLKPLTFGRPSASRLA